MILVSSIVLTKLILSHNENNIWIKKEEVTVYTEKDSLVKEITTKIYKNINYIQESHEKRLNGTVGLFLKIYKDGTATITKLEGDKRFHLSVKESVKKTFPIKVIDNNISFPRDISIKIRFKFNL